MGKIRKTINTTPWEGLEHLESRVTGEAKKKTQPRRTVQMAVEVKLTTRAQQLHSPFHPREMKTYHHSMAPYLESQGW